ncbi:MAG: DUF1211 domain-containing protein, partial [Propionibacteriales bacterium]|nr:DUF1211 domain-containing protein [Propionibacteriales bacterium]
MSQQTGSAFRRTAWSSGPSVASWDSAAVCCRRWRRRGRPRSRGAGSQGQAGTLGDALLDQWPTYLVYVFGFVQMFGGWAASRRLGAMLARADHYVLLMTMLALMSFVLTPFTFAVLGD